MEYITQELLLKELNYNPETGIFVRIAEGRGRKFGTFAGCPHPETGHVSIAIAGKEYKAHRLAWLYVYGSLPDMVVDHINGNPLDNRICNLRQVSQQENTQNQRKAKSNSLSGLLGVNSKPERHRARICVDGKNVHLGYFKTKEEAHQAYLVAKRKLHKGCTI